MKRIISQVILGVLVFLIGTNVYSQGYNIEVKIDNFGSQEIYMGHYFSDKTYVKDTVKTDANGVARFKGEKKLEGGIYFVVLPTKTIAWEFLMTDNQSFSMHTDSEDYIGKLRAVNHPENAKFFEYSKFMRDRNKDMGQFQEEYQSASKEGQDAVRKKIEELQMQVKNQWDEFIAQNPGTFFANVIKAQKYPEFPEFDIPESVSNKDSLLQIKRYYYNKNHWFDNIDFTDEKLLRTSYVYSRLQTFFTQMVMDPDTVIAEGEKIIKRSEKNPDMFRFLVEYMLNLNYETKRMGMDKVLVHIGEEYYLSGRAHWVEPDRLEKIKDRVIKTRPNILGTKVKDMRFVSLDNSIVNLYSLNSEYVILAFWEPGCGHCKKVLPKLHDIYTDMRWKKDMSVEVMAIFTQVKEYEEWKSFLEENAITDWVNAYDPYGWSGFRDQFDIYSTPTVYLLNKNKEIIAKRIDVERIPEFIENYESFK